MTSLAVQAWSFWRKLVCLLWKFVLCYCKCLAFVVVYVDVERLVWCEDFIPWVPLLVTYHSLLCHLMLSDTRGERPCSISSVVVPSVFALSWVRLIVSKKRSAWPLDCGWLGGARTCVIQLDQQKWRNDPDVNGVPFSESNVSSKSCWLNSRLRIVMIEWMSVFFSWKISGYLEWVSTTTRKLRPIIGHAKSTCIRNRGCSGYVQCETTIWGEFSVFLFKGHNSWISFWCQGPHWASTLHCELWLSFGWYQDVLSVVV